MVNKINSRTDQNGQFGGLSAENAIILAHLLNHDYADADIIRLATFIRNNPSPILAFSPHGDVIKTNPAAEQLLKRLQVEPTALLPANHAQIVQGCLAGCREYAIEVTVNGHILALTYHPLSAFKLVYLYAIDITEYRRSEAELLHIVDRTVALARLAVRQLQTFQARLPERRSSKAMASDSDCASHRSDQMDWFIAMDGCGFASAGLEQ